MATNKKTIDPVCDVSIIKTKRVLLVENIIFENVMPCIKSFLVPAQIDAILAKKSGFDRIGKILDYVARLAKCSQYAAFNALMKTVAGTQPELFKCLLWRAPTETEMAFCVKDIVQDVKNSIIKTGHHTDSELDEIINFEYEHVELSVVGSRSESTSEVPHEYGDYLTRLGGTGGNISACDILSRDSKPNTKVLVFGRPGVGKSTTTQWLVRLWAQGKWATSITLLFLLQVRFLTYVDVPITALELLTLYGLYQLEDMADSVVLSSWLKNPKSRILIFIDGLDEIPGFANRMINTHRISDLTHKAHPIDLVINILRGDLLPHSAVISASRPFLGLSNLCVDSKAEVLGMTPRKVTEYVERRYPEKASHILSVLERNPILLSVCGITFYTMMISRLLSEGVVLIEEEVQTYTRLMAFILVQYISRKIKGSDFIFETNSYLAKLAKLAFSGIFQSQENAKFAKLVFDEKDLLSSKLSHDDLANAKKTGIIQIREHHIGGRKSIIVEFFQLSGQEILAVLHFLSTFEQSDYVLDQLLAGGHLDMVLMFTFGLHFDRTSTWADELRTALGSTSPYADTSLTSQLSMFIDRLWKQSGSKIKVCQLLYEAQWVYKAREFGQIAPNGKLSIENVSMTAIDVLAVDFVCRCSGALSSITLRWVNADDTFVKVMVSSLCKNNHQTLQVLDLSANSIGAVGAAALASMLHTNTHIHTLYIGGNSIGSAGAAALASMLHTNTSIQTLHIAANSIGAAGAAALASMLHTNTSIHTLHLNRNSIGTSGVEALAAALSVNTTLTELDVTANNISDVGVDVMLMCNHSLHTLYIS